MASRPTGKKRGNMILYIDDLRKREVYRAAIKNSKYRTITEFLEEKMRLCFDEVESSFTKYENEEVDVAGILKERREKKGEINVG